MSFFSLHGLIIQKLAESITIINDTSKMLVGYSYHARRWQQSIATYNVWKYSRKINPNLQSSAKSNPHHMVIQIQIVIQSTSHQNKFSE